jgi:error-prone DNA polymerase
MMLARAGACASFGGDRRDVLWQLAALDRDPRGLFANAPRTGRASPLPPTTPLEATLADYAATGLTTGPHVMAHLRDDLRRRGVLSSVDLRQARDGSIVRIAGHVIVRQRPGTAKGMLFLTLEDELGTANAVITPPTFRRHRRLLHTCGLLLVEGPLQKVDGVTHVRGQRFEELVVAGSAPPSHDFH